MGFMYRFSSTDLPAHIAACIAVLDEEPAVLAERCTAFLHCLQTGLDRHLCNGCVDKYWNDFRAMSAEEIALEMEAVVAEEKE